MHNPHDKISWHQYYDYLFQCDFLFAQMPVHANINKKGIVPPRYPSFECETDDLEHGERGNAGEEGNDLATKDESSSSTAGNERRWRWFCASGCGTGTSARCSATWCYGSGVAGWVWDCGRGRHGSGGCCGHGGGHSASGTGGRLGGCRRASRGASSRSVAEDGLNVARVTLGTLALVVEVVEGGLGWGRVVQALVEDGTSTDSETGVLADGETRCEERILLGWVVELEL